ncbi:MAG: hypothetical protein ACREVE_11875 [Gammaproteobacteria bacterium]
MKEMKSIQQFPNSLQPVFLASVVLAGTLGTAITAAAQEFQDLQTPKSPLVLKTQGSFFVGGETAEQTFIEVGSFGNGGGHITVNQMYVEYMVPQGRQKVPVVMIHGLSLSGKTYETTPDGRMGWDEYFVRNDHPMYVVDQVSRARSGFPQAVFNNVGEGVVTPTAQPHMIRFTDEITWPNFRIGPEPGTPFPEAKFPVAALDELSEQGIPAFNAVLPSPDPNFKALSELATELDGAVIMGHSQGGLMPVEAALTNSAVAKGLVLVEPGSCGSNYTDEEIDTLATVPILVVFGDNLGVDTGVPGFSWQNSFNGCNTFIDLVNAAGGNAQMLYTPDLGIFGNSHMIMQDKNNLQIADLILEWIDENVGKRKVAKK